MARQTMVHHFRPSSNLEVRLLEVSLSTLAMGLAAVCHLMGVEVQAHGLQALLLPERPRHSIHLPLRLELLHLDTTVHLVRLGHLQARRDSVPPVPHTLHPQRSHQQAHPILLRVLHMVVQRLHHTHLRALHTHLQVRHTIRAFHQQAPPTHQHRLLILLLLPLSRKRLQDQAQAVSALPHQSTLPHPLVTHLRVLHTSRLDHQSALLAQNTARMCLILISSPNPVLTLRQS